MGDTPDPTQAADLCPRCGGAFHCGRSDAAPCPCASLTLSAATLVWLHVRYSGCLCLGCLGALARDEQAGRAR